MTPRVVRRTFYFWIQLFYLANTRYLRCQCFTLAGWTLSFDAPWPPLGNCLGQCSKIRMNIWSLSYFNLFPVFGSRFQRISKAFNGRTNSSTGKLVVQHYSYQFRRSSNLRLAMTNHPVTDPHRRHLISLGFTVLQALFYTIHFCFFDSWLLCSDRPNRWRLGRAIPGIGGRGILFCALAAFNYLKQHPRLC